MKILPSISLLNIPTHLVASHPAKRLNGLRMTKPRATWGSERSRGGRERQRRVTESKMGDGGRIKLSQKREAFEGIKPSCRLEASPILRPASSQG